MSVNYSRIVPMAAGDTTTPWFRLNGAVEAGKVRGIAGALTAGDTIQIQVTHQNLSNNDKSLSEVPGSTAANTVAVSDTFSTTQFQTILNGNWNWIRAVKTGSNGPATITFEL